MKKGCLLILSLCLWLVTEAQYNKDVRLESVLKTDTTSLGQKIVYPNFENAQVSILKVTIPPGKSTGWHKHSFPVFAYVLKGILTVEVENSKTLEFLQNSSFAEVVNVNHNGVNRGDEDVVLIAFFMGEKGQPLSVHRQKQ